MLINDSINSSKDSAFVIKPEWSNISVKCESNLQGRYGLLLLLVPEYLEKYLPVIGVKFDYAVFDEIHNVNKEDDGDIYENIIKLLPCNFLALSATIGNIEFLQEVFHKIHPEKEISYVEYNKRFINQQR